jgi:hypothetical protein
MLLFGIKGLYKNVCIWYNPLYIIIIFAKTTRHNIEYISHM